MKISGLILLILAWFLAPQLFSLLGWLFSFILGVLFILFVAILLFFKWNKNKIQYQTNNTSSTTHQQTQQDVVDVEFKTKDLDE